MINMKDIMETVQMIEEEHLDIRTITMGISLLSCCDPDIDRSCQKVYDKITTYAKWAASPNLSDDEVLYMGDDIPDSEVMQRCGCPCAPADAAPEIRALARYVRQYAGGQGCVRDVGEQVLRAQGLWMSDRHAFGW